MGIFASIAEGLGKQSSVAEHLRSMAKEGPLQALGSEVQAQLVSKVEAMGNAAQSALFSHFGRLSGEQLKSISEGADPSLFYGDKQSKTQQYTVRRGDSLSKIAKAHKVGLAKVIAANPQIDDPDRIYPDQVINLP